MPIRPAREEDLPRLQQIEVSAGGGFAAIGMAAIADDPPPTIETLRAFVVAQTAWVSTDANDVAVAYLVAELVDGNAHLEQVSVHESHTGQKLGRALIDHLQAWARERSLPAITLTTFRDVPWNGPYYQRLGFEYLPDTELGPQLRAIRAAEAARGLDRWPRAAMRLTIAA